jgi:hypothetical protein
MPDAGAAQAASVLTFEQLRTMGLSPCPVPGCKKKPEGFKSKQALKFHLQSHAPQDLALLPDGGAGGGTRSSLPPGPYHCGEAGCAFGLGKKTLKNVKTATQHSKTHTQPGAATHECDRCHKTFALRYRLTEHAKTCGQSTFKCKCGLTMAHKSSLKTHIQQWAGSAPDAHGEVKSEHGVPVGEGAEGEAEADAGLVAEHDLAAIHAAGVPPHEEAGGL